MFPVGKIAAVVGGRLIRGDATAPTRIVHDSRAVREGDLFVALRGRRVDGHTFLTDAFERGACGALVSNPSLVPDARNVIVVDDVLAALQRLAGAWRGSLGATIVGITGSNGKTTTRALLAHLLREDPAEATVFSAPKNYNTEIGLPLALLAMPPTASIGLFELGAERPGDIPPLADLLSPQIGLITSIGPSHLDGLRTVAAVATEKWALVERLPSDGLAVLNADSPHLRARLAETPCRCLTVGLEHGRIRGRIVREVPRLVVGVDDPPLRLDCPLIGRLNATNLLLAAGTAHQLGVPTEAIERRAQTFDPVPHRFQPVTAPFGTILDDTYNANPASTAGALRTLARLGGRQTRRVFVFGEMRDLGLDADRYHREILDLAVELNVDLIVPVGERATAACRERPSPSVALVEGGQVADAVRRFCQAGEEALVLVKGSRALELERLVDRIVGGGSSSQGPLRAPT